MNIHPIRRSILPIAAVILFGLLLTSPELLHAHGHGLGLYNADCPLPKSRHATVKLRCRLRPRSWRLGGQPVWLRSLPLAMLLCGSLVTPILALPPLV
jgi:hypothetical protein